MSKKGRKKFLFSRDTDDTESNGLNDTSIVEENAPDGQSDTPPSEAQSAQSIPSTDEQKPAQEKVTEELLSALNDKYLRLLADYDNYRKRTAREFQELIKTAHEKLMRELLPILDALDRATEHKNNTTNLEEYVKGLALIEEQLREALSRAGLEKMDVIGKTFDPVIHDAVTQIETNDYEPGTIAAEMEKGYLLAGKVIRHPKVIVSKKKENQPST
jgi:molecular chaperone GrpE